MNFRKLLTLACLFVTGLNLVFADEFSDLEKKQTAVAAKDPFANRKAMCVTTTDKGLQLTMKWNFFGGTSAFIQTRPGIGLLWSGKYEVIGGDRLRIKVEKVSIGSQTDKPTDKSAEYKIKLTPPTGFKLIEQGTGRDGKEFKYLYSCRWTVL